MSWTTLEFVPQCDTTFLLLLEFIIALAFPLALPILHFLNVFLSVYFHAHGSLGSGVV